MHHFVAICEFQLELYSGKAHIGAKFALTSVTFTFDSWPFIWTTLLSMVKTLEHFIIIRWQEHCEKGVTGGRTERTVHIAAWSQLKKTIPKIMTGTDLWIHVSCHVIECVGMYETFQLCMDAWHFINKTFISIYFSKFPDLSLKCYSDLYSYRKNQDYVYGKGSTMVLGKNKIRFEKYTVKRIMWKKTPHTLPS